MIIFDRTTDDEQINRIMIDDYKGAYKATEHLIHNGFKQIAHFSVNTKIKIYQERLRGYKDALADYDMTYNPAYVVEAKSNVEAGKEAMQELLQLPSPPDSLFSSSDYCALGAIKVLQEYHIKIPEEFGVIGFSNEPFTAHITPAMSSVDQEPMIMGQKIGEIMIDLIDPQKDAPLDNKTLVLEPQLVIRASSQRRN